MTEKEMKSLKPIDLSGLRHISEHFKELQKSVAVVPKIENLTDPKVETLKSIAGGVDEIKRDNKNHFWKDLLIAIVGGLVGGSVPYLLALLFA